jgi:glycosyltransferase involved in cell wall biosynthesis
MLSVVIISFNEEDKIARCIDSVKNIADEIIVVDSFSKDNTKAICIEKGVRFLDHAFDGYVQQKNWANSQASYDYILSLDADEALDNTMQKALLAEKNHFSKDAYFLNRMPNYLGKWIKYGSWYPDYTIRLWNRKKGSWGGGNVHEYVEMQQNSSTGKLPGDILHYSYTSIEGHVAQLDKFTSISAKNLYNDGKKASLLKIYLSPFVSFIKGFLLRLGFLDGHYGIVICIMNAYATHLKYIKLRELTKKQLK